MEEKKKRWSINILERTRAKKKKEGYDEDFTTTRKQGLKKNKNKQTAS